MKYDLPGYDQVTREALRAADEAARYNWSLDELIRAIEQAWIYTYQDRLKVAQYQVEQRHKESMQKEPRR